MRSSSSLASYSLSCWVLCRKPASGSPSRLFREAMRGYRPTLEDSYGVEPLLLAYRALYGLQQAVSRQKRSATIIYCPRRSACEVPKVCESAIGLDSFCKLYCSQINWNKAKEKRFCSHSEAVLASANSANFRQLMILVAVQCSRDMML